MKKLVLSVLSAVLFAGSFLGAAPLVQAAYDQEYLDAFERAKENGLTSMSDADAFGPYRSLTRQEWSKFIGTFGEDFLCLETNPDTTCEFADAEDVSPYLSAAVMKACELGLMRGSNGSFYPNTFVSKAQVLATLVRGMADYMDETVSPWYANYHAYALENGITTVTDVNSFDRPVSRAEAVIMLYRSRDYECDFDTVDGTGSTVPTPIGTNRAKLVRNSDSPMGQNGTIYIGNTSYNNEVLKFDVTADENGNLTTVTIKLDDSLMDRRYVQVSIANDDGVKVTNSRTFNNFSEAILSFTTPVALRKNELKSFWVMFDSLTGSSVNQRGTVKVTNATLSNGTVAVDDGVISAAIQTIDISNQSRITFTAQGGAGMTGAIWTGANSCTLSTYVYVGDTNKLIGRFSLENNSSSKAVDVKSIRLKSSKSLNGIVGNLRLEVGTGVVPATVSVDGKFVTFVLSSYTLPYSTTRSFYIKGDIIGGDKDDPIEFYLDDASDITAREADSMLSVNVTRHSNSYASALYCVKEGSNSIVRADTVTNMNVPTREPLVFGLRANVNTKSAIRTEKIRVYIDNKTSTGTYTTPERSAENFRLYVNNIMVDSTSNVLGSAVCEGTAGVTSTNTCYIEFNYYGDFVAGVNTLEVRFDTLSSATAGDRIRFRIDANSFAFAGNAEYVSTQNNVVASDFNGTAVGSEMIITNASVDNISRTDNFSNGKIMVAESTDFVALRFAARANNVRDLVLNGFKVNLNFINPTSSSNSNYVSDVMAYVDGVLVATQAFNNGTTATFNSLGIIIPKGTSKEITLKVTTTSSHPSSSSTGDVFYTIDTFDLDDTNGNSVTGPGSLTGAQLDVVSSIAVQCKNVSPIASSIIPLSTIAVPVANFEFKSDNGNAVINELSLVNLSGSQNSVPSAYSTTTLAASGFDISADGIVLELYVGNTKVGEATLINAIAYAIGLNGGAGIVLPNNSAVTVQVRAKLLNPLGSYASTRTLRLGVVPSTNFSLVGGTAQTMVSAQNSSASATLGVCTGVANSQIIRSTRLSLAVNAPSSVVSPVVSAGTDVFAVRATADAAGSVLLKKLTFNVAVTSGTTVTASNFTLRANGTKLTNGTDIDCVYSGTTSTVTCVFTGGYAEGYSVAAGSTTEFKLTVDSAAITVATAGSISVNMTQQSTNTTPSTYSTLSTASTSVVWSDQSEVGHGLTTSDWFTDAGMTIDSYSQTYYRN
ncbi:MAG: S-layer homology domain-containing protein [Candidatus Absconditabacterales bacterium]